MGLDIYHCKATLIKPKNLHPFKDNYVTKDDYEGFDAEFDFFKDYIQEIEIPKILRTLIFAKDESKVGEIKAFLSRNNDIFYVPLSDINAFTEHFLVQNNLCGSLLHQWETQSWIGVYVFELERKTGFYYEESGYQRKGMNEHFWEHFNSALIYKYTQKSDFEYALSCVDFYWNSDTAEEVRQRKEEFKTYFVDNYEHGKSWMWLSF